MHEIFEYIGKEWAVLKGAPLAFFGLLVVGLVAGYGLGTWYYKREISFLERQVSDYRERLGLAPRNAVHAKLTNAELRGLADDIVKKVREFAARIEEEDRLLFHSRKPLTGSQEERTKQFEAYGQQIQARQEQHRQEFASKFRADATNVFQEIRSRLPESSRPTRKPGGNDGTTLPDRVALVALEEGMLAGPHPAASVADLIERLAKQLP